MARSTKKSTTQEIAEALNTPVNLNWCDVAEDLSITIPDLQERFAAKLNDSTVFTWDTIPVEHQAVVDAIARDLEAEASVRRLESAQPLPQASEQPLEPPLLEEKPEAKPKRQRRSSALTQGKSSSLKNSDKNSQQMASTDLQVKEVLHARKGQKSGARLATLELLAEDSTYRKIKGEGLVRKVAQLTQELSAEADFDPIATLQELGIDANSDLYQDLRQQIEPALGKVESATAEIVETAWVNGIDLDVSHLESLLNSNEY
jgi:hypothetical protein